MAYNASLHFSGSFYEVSEDLLADEPTDALVAFVEGIIQEGALGAVIAGSFVRLGPPFSCRRMGVQRTNSHTDN